MATRCIQLPKTGMERGRKIVDEIIAFPSRSGCAKVTSPLARINRSPSGDQLNGQDIKRSFRALPSPPFSLSGPCEISRKIVPTFSLLAGIIENGAATLTRPCFPSSSPTLRIRGRRNFSKNFFRRVGSNFGGICSISKKKTCTLRNQTAVKLVLFLPKILANRHATKRRFLFSFLLVSISFQNRTQIDSNESTRNGIIQ